MSETRTRIETVVTPQESEVTQPSSAAEEDVSSVEPTPATHSTDTASLASPVVQARGRGGNGVAVAALAMALGGAAFAAARLLLARRASSRATQRGATVSGTHGSVLCELDLPPAPALAPPAAPLPLAGLRFAVKDIFDVEGTVTGFGSPDWAATHGAATRTAPVVTACQAAGARGTCKTVMDELAYSISGENMHFGTPDNPAAPGHLPGGSSSGSAVACAASLVDFALGTDTGGSVRVPAAHCGLFGIRPTHGAVSVSGVLPMAQTFDTVGWFARDARTLRRVGHVLLPQSSDSAAFAGDSVQVPPVKVLAVAEDCLRLAGPDAVAAVAALLQAVATTCPGAQASRLKVGAFFKEQCSGLKAFVTGAYSPHSTHADSSSSVDDDDDNNVEGLTALRTALRVLQGHELWAAVGSWVTASQPELGPDIRARLDFAASVTPGAADAASVAVTQARQAAEVLFGGPLGSTFIVLPTVPVPAPAVRQNGAAREDWRARCMAMLSIAGMAGLPQVHLPLGNTPAGLPIGVSLLGPRGGDHALLALAQALAAPAAGAYAASLSAAAGKVTSTGREHSSSSSSSSVPNGHVHSSAASSSTPSAASGASAVDAVIEQLKQKGNVAFKEGRYHDAIEHYSAALHKAPADAAAPQLAAVRAVLLSNRAMAHLKRGDFRACEDDCTSCLAADANNVKALLRRGTARAFVGDLAQAYGDFEAVLAIEPQNKDALGELARLRQLAGGDAA